MFELGAIPLGVTLFLAGLVFLLLAFFSLRVIPQNISFFRGSSRPPVLPDTPQHGHAVLVIQPGGRISFMNQEARSMFNTWSEAPNLDRLARRTRPGDVFLGLCAAEGQARFSIEGQMMEVTSYLVPNGNGNAILLSIRPDQQAALTSDDRGYSNHTVEILTAVSQSIAINLELEATLQSILSSVDQLLPNDFAEIAIWDADEGCLVPYRFVGAPGADRHIEVAEERYPLGEGYSGHVAEKRQPVLIADVDTFREFRPLINRQKYPFHSYIGYPLVIGGELIGSLGLTSLDRNAFDENDIEVLRLLSGQAAIAVHNALVYQEEKRRALELSSLANLTQAVSSVRDSKELFARLAQGISPLLDVQIAGFLVFDEAHRRLAAQNPFIGVPPQFVELYQIEIPPDSPADKIWRGQETLIVTNAGDDPTMIALGLDHSSRASGIKHTVLMPLRSGSRSLGYLQAANKRDGSPFTHDDVRLLSIIAGQAAPIIENADLVQQAIQRALRAESLRRIASLSGSEAALDEILKYSVIELSRLLKVDSAAIFFYDESLGELQAHIESVYGVPSDLYEKLGRIPVEEEFSKFIVSNNQQPFISDNTLEDPRVLPPYRLLIDSMGVLSAVDVPLVFRGRGLGEMMMASKRYEHFNRSDIQLIKTVADQLAVAVERASLASQTDEDLRQRVEQLTALTRVGRELNASLNLKRLLRRVYEEALKTTRADCGTILLFEMGDTPASNPKVRLHIGDEPGKDLHPLERVVLEKDAPVLVEDFDDPPPSLDEATVRPAHEGVHSALILPIAYQGDVVGLFHLHAAQPGRFNDAALQIAQALAVQAAVAIGNVQRYQEQVQNNRQLTKRIKALTGLIEASGGAYDDQPLEKSLRDMASRIREVAAFPEVLVGVLGGEGNLEWIATAGVSQARLASLRKSSPKWSDVENALSSEYLLMSSYFIPIEKPADVDEWLSVLTNSHERQGGHEAVLLQPLLKSASQPLGLIAIASLPGDEYPDRVSLEILDNFSRQACLVIDHHQWADQLELQIENLAAQLDSSSQTAERLLAQFPHPHSEQRVNAVLEIIENLARQPDRSAVLEALGQGLLSHLGLDNVLVVEMGADGLQLLHVLGEIPPKLKLEALFGQRNPLYSSLNEGRLHLAPDIEGDEQWQKSPLLEALGAEGFLSLPILSQAGSPAAVLGVSSSPLADFSPDDGKLFDMLARQTATALNNLTLLTETGHRLREVYLLLEFSRQLGGMEAEKVMSLLVDSALEVVQLAQACMAVIFEPDRGVLKPRAARGYADNAAMLEIEFRPGEALVGQVFDDGRTRRISEVDFSRHFDLDSAALLRYREGTDGILPVSSMAVPIHSGQSALGVLVLDNFQDENAFSTDDQALVTSLSRQAALALQNAALFVQTQRLTEDLEKRVEERTMQLEREHRRAQALLSIMRELSASLDLDHVLNRTLQLLNEITDSEQSTILLTRPNEDTFYFRASLGYTEPPPVGGRSAELEIGDGLAGWMVTHREGVLIADLREDDRWRCVDERETSHRSAIGVPLLVGAELLGVMFLFHRQTYHFTSRQMEMAQAAANQIAVSINNAELFNLIREQAERLGNMLRTQQVETSRSRAILEAVADGVLVTDAENRITLFNDSAQYILSLERGQVVGRSLESFSGLFGGATQTWMNTIADWSTSPRADGEGGTYAEQITLDDGRFVAIHLAPVYMQDEFLGTVSIFRDITHQVEVDRLKSEFVATVSHELRTPMTSIKGYVEILLMGAAGNLTEQQTQFLEVVLSNAQRLNVLVNDLLDVSRIDAGKYDLSMQSLRLQDLTFSVVEEQRRQAEKEAKPITIDCDIPFDLPRVRGDEERVRQILANLVSNAYHYTPANGHIHIQARSLGAEVQVDVADNGIGIAQGEQERVFERFYRGEDPLVLATAGTGLGLSIVQQLIDLHGGRIWVRSDGIPGEGSTFSFTLPVFTDEFPGETQE